MNEFMILVWLVATVSIYFYAERLNRLGVGYVVLSVVISPLLTWIVLLAMGKNTNVSSLSSKDGVHEWKD